MEKAKEITTEVKQEVKEAATEVAAKVHTVLVQRTKGGR